MAATVSLSKGVFAFKRNSRKKVNDEQIFDTTSCWRLEPGRNDEEIRCLTYSNYHKEWQLTNSIVENLLHDIHCKVLEDLIKYIKHVGTSKELENLHIENQTELISTASKDIPAACLVTGVNMPDHDSLFGSLTKSLLNQVSPYVARLSSSNCSNVKGAIFHIVNSFMSGDDEAFYEDSDNEEEILVNNSPTKMILKKNQYNMTVLNAWYNENLLSSNSSMMYKEASPRKKIKTSPVGIKSPRKKNVHHEILEMKPLIVIIEDLEGIPPTVIQDLILICSEYRQKGLPFVFVLGVATTPAVIHRNLSQDATTSVAIETFQAQPSSTLLSQVIDKLFMSSMAFKVGGKIFKLLIDIFLFHDLSVHNFIQGVKYCMLEHYLRGSVSFLCCQRPKRVKHLKDLGNDALTALRELPSCIRHILSLDEKRQKELEDSDSEFKDMVLTELDNLDVWYENFCILVRVLHKMVYKLPGTPLGRQVREVFSICLSQQVTDSTEFQDSWKFLLFSGRAELIGKLTEINTSLADYTENSKFAAELFEKLSKFVIDLENVHLIVKEKEDSKSPIKILNLKSSDRFNLREKLLGSVKGKSQSPFEELRTEIMSSFEHLFIVHLKPPSSRPFHEVCFFDSIGTVKYQMLGSVRATITTGLSNPQKYLQCSCCVLSDSANLSNTLPDLTLCYKLHLECGRMINLYDWMQAFIAIVQGDTNEDEVTVVKKRGKIVNKKKDVDQTLQARFIQAVSELQLLGFIKPTKRKTDHVQRLTWGGC